MTSLHVICGLAPNPIQNPGYAYASNHVQCACQIPVVALCIVTRTFTSANNIAKVQNIAVGGGGAGGAVAPPIGSKRRKTSKIWANSLFIWAAILFVWAHDWQKNVSVSFFFFFFFEIT